MEFVTEANRVYYTDGTNVLAEITFPQTQPGTFCINHTQVDDSLRGKGIAGQLVQLAVDAIKAQGGAVTATCSYAQSWLQKHTV